ncbi:MAG: DUF599 domain-containing protein [Alphaproteobacteria bacterium]|nr:DUF599 domain-containing protein [Alphaproteobacteria bacterium]
MDEVTWLDIRVDLYSFVISVGMIVAYHIIIAQKVRKNPAYTLRSVMNCARAAWVRSVMTANRDILAVQPLRNSTMAATFLASTSILLIIGVLTLSEQGDKLGATWHVLGVVGATKQEMWLTKLIVLLLDLFVAFFSFALSIRLFNLVGYMINVPLALGHKMISPDHVAAELNLAGMWYGIGMRAYYYLVPLVMWLFGPHFMVLSTPVLLLVVFLTDHFPRKAGRRSPVENFDTIGSKQPEARVP